MGISFWIFVEEGRLEGEGGVVCDRVPIFHVVCVSDITKIGVFFFCTFRAGGAGTLHRARGVFRRTVQNKQNEKQKRRRSKD